MATLEELQNRDYYEVLNVSPDASIDAIKDAYKEIAKIYHPDSNFYAEIIATPLTSDEEKAFKIITQAYNTLTNPDKRKEYDAVLPRNLRDWDEPNDPWDNKARSEDALEKMAINAAMLGRPIATLGKFGKIPHQVEEVEDVPIQERLNKDVIILIVAGVVFMVSVIALIFIVIR